ncbi:hypothetical protein RCL1_008948 [Eukaryota sp. TZLM3-RCL]
MSKKDENEANNSLIRRDNRPRKDQVHSRILPNFSQTFSPSMNFNDSITIHEPLELQCPSLRDKKLQLKEKLHIQSCLELFFVNNLLQGSFPTLEQVRSLIDPCLEITKSISLEQYLLTNFPVILVFIDETNTLVQPYALEERLFSTSQVFSQVAHHKKLETTPKYIRGQYKCSRCGDFGHTKSKCPKFYSNIKK